MNEYVDSARIVASDEYLIAGWFRIIVITESEFIYGDLKANKRDLILEALESGEDPAETIEYNSLPSHAPKIVPLENIAAIEWYDEAPKIKLHYFDEVKNKSKRASITLSSIGARDSILDVIKRSIGECREMRGAAGTWYNAIVPLTALGCILLLCCFRAFYRYVKYHPLNDEDLVQPASNLLADILYWFNPVELLLIGGFILAAPIWWFIRCRNPSNRTIISPIRSDA